MFVSFVVIVLAIIFKFSHRKTRHERNTKRTEPSKRYDQNFKYSVVEHRLMRVTDYKPSSVGVFVRRA